jgi:tetratricopeptide (TPR) repeat protein
MKPWDMIFSHRYAEAAAIYEAELRLNSNDPGLLSAHATAILCMGRMEESLREFERANKLANRRLKGETQPYLETIGTLLWLLGRREEAVEKFQQGVDEITDGSIKFADNAGGVSHGVLLWYAGVSVPSPDAKKTAIKYLSKLATKPRIQSWPGPVAQLVLGQKQPTDILAAATGASNISEAVLVAKSDLLKRRQLTNALFYMAIAERDRGSEPECRRIMTECADLENPILEMEWFLARGELDLPFATEKGVSP